MIRRLAALIAVVVLALSGCAGGRDTPTLTVYSVSGLGGWYAREFEKFTAETGIKVTVFEAGSGELVSRVNSRAVWEQVDGAESVPPADLLITLPPFIQRAAKAGLLQPSGVDTSGISTPVVDPGGLYVPIVRTALCFIANPAADPRPVTFDDLLRPELKGRLQYSTPGEAGDGTAMLILLQHLMGQRGALDYLRRLQANNVGPSSSTGALQPKVDSGELMVANGDLQMNLASIKNDGAKFRIFFPAMPDNTRTTVALPYVAGVTAETQRPEEAKKLLSLLLSDDAQRSVAADFSGIPVRDAIAREASPESVAGYLQGVTLWVPDWNAVLANLDGDIAAYKQATGS